MKKEFNRYSLTCSMTIIEGIQEGIFQIPRQALLPLLKILFCCVLTCLSRFTPCTLQQSGFTVPALSITKSGSKPEMRRKCIEASLYVHCYTATNDQQEPEAIIQCWTQNLHHVLSISTEHTRCRSSLPTSPWILSCTFMKNIVSRTVIQAFQILSLLIPSPPPLHPIPAPLTYILITVITLVQPYWSNFSQIICMVLLDSGLSIFPYC